MAKEQNQKPVHCPNCNQPALRQGNEIICELCDAVFKITKSDGARVKKIGTIENLQNRIAKMEAEIFPVEPEPAKQLLAEQFENGRGTVGPGANEDEDKNDDKDGW